MKRLVVLSMVGCAHLFACVTVLGPVEAFRTSWLPHASFDMNCPRDELQVKDLGDNAVGVRGCGKRAQYLYRGGDDPEVENQWILSGAVSAEAPAPSR